MLCAEHVSPLFEHEQPSDPRQREAINVGRAWIRGEVRVGDAHRVAFATNAAARGPAGAAKSAALAAGQAVAVAHVAAHDLGAAAYAIRSACALAHGGETEAPRVRESGWQRDQIPVDVLDLVLDDQRRRSAICWHAFDD